MNNIYKFLSSVAIMTVGIGTPVYYATKRHEKQIKSSISSKKF